jgi:hypothetical protein
MKMETNVPDPHQIVEYVRAFLAQNGHKYGRFRFFFSRPPLIQLFSLCIFG